MRRLGATNNTRENPASASPPHHFTQASSPSTGVESILWQIHASASRPRTTRPSQLPRQCKQLKLPLMYERGRSQRQKKDEGVSFSARTQLGSPFEDASQHRQCDGDHGSRPDQTLDKNLELDHLMVALWSLLLPTRSKRIVSLASFQEL
jgi:hypothetical protein